MEYWDAYDENVTKTGETLIRGQKIPHGRFHLVVEAVIQASDGSILFMKRDSNKPIYPDYFEASAGGSVLKGEDSLTAIKREIFEETGLEPSTITFFGESIKPNEFSIYHNYHAHFNGDKHKVQLQDTETVDFKWIALEDLEAFFEQEQVIPKQKEILTNFLKKQEWKIEKTK